jgi:hypothetical protein
VFLSLVVVFPAGAKGAVDRVSLVGPHWYGEVEITDREVLDVLGLGLFADLEKPLERAPLVSAGYLMTRSFELEGEYRLLDRLMYFPGEEPGEGVVYYIEMVDAHGPYDGKWFRVRMESEATLLNYLSQEGILPSSIVFQSPENISSGADQALLVGGGMLLMGLLVGVALGRRAPA